MQLKITTDYAIRMILYLANKKEITNSIQISDELGIPWKYLINIGSMLKHAGLINTHKGKHGGYTLAKSAETIRIYDIISTTEKNIKINRCLEGEEYCSADVANNCKVKIFYSTVQEKIEQYFKGVTIADLVEDAEGKEPFTAFLN